MLQISPLKCVVSSPSEIINIIKQAGLSDGSTSLGDLCLVMLEVALHLDKLEPS